MGKLSVFHKGQQIIAWDEKSGKNLLHALNIDPNLFWRPLEERGNQISPLHLRRTVKSQGGPIHEI